MLDSTGGNTGVTSNVVETVKGVSGLGGTYTISYEDSYSDDIGFQARAEELKAILEKMPTIDEVDVHKEILGASLRYTVTFTKQLGNLRMMQASPYTYEVQKVTTTGGDPTPLGGTFTLYFGNVSTDDIPFDASAAAMRDALMSIPTIERVDVNKVELDHNCASWVVTFRSEVGDLELMTWSADHLTGTDAAVSITEIVVGNEASFFGNTPAVDIKEKVAGFPSYTGRYIPNATGSYDIFVRQLSQGGLSAQYFDNQWLQGDPTAERIDAAIKFDWGYGAITPYGRDYVSIRWSGKLIADFDEIYTFYLHADDGVRLFLDHELVIDAWDVVLIEGHRHSKRLHRGSFHDIVIEYKEITGAASIVLEWSSYSISREVVPSLKLFHCEHIAASPFRNVTVLPGRADYPYTSAIGDSLSKATSGVLAKFRVVARDANNNTRISEPEEDDFTDVLEVEIVGPTRIAGHVQYIGAGEYDVSYMPLKTGSYKIYVRTGGSNIQCGFGDVSSCSPFLLNVEPGAATAATSEVESAPAPRMDSLVEAAAGDTGAFAISAKDAYGNYLRVGGDDFEVMFVSQNNADIQYRGYLHDYNNGSYLASYTIPIAGSYEVRVTHNGDPLLMCVSPMRPFWWEREYNGLEVYKPPNYCSHAAPALRVVHGPLHAPTSQARGPGISNAIAGIPTILHILANDAFGNLRSGEGTPHFEDGYYGGESRYAGASDYFLVVFEHASRNYSVITSTAIQTICVRDASHSGLYRLHFAGESTLSIPLNATAGAVKSALENAHSSGIFSVSVTRSYQIEQGCDHVYTVTFLSNLDAWASDSLIAIPSSDGKDDGLDEVVISRPASGGMYPVEVTLWYDGDYELSITSNNRHIDGSPFEVKVAHGVVDSQSTTVASEHLSQATAGEPVILNITARDARVPETQVITVLAEEISITPETQMVTTGANDFALEFRGELTPFIILGSTTTFAVESMLESLVTIGVSGAIQVTDSGNADGIIDSTESFEVSFSNVYGDLPLMIPSDNSATVVEITKGEFLRLCTISAT